MSDQDAKSQARDAFARLSGMPEAYFEKHRTEYPEGDESALRVFLALRTAARRVDTVVAGWLEPTDLTLTKLDVLHLLAASGEGATVTELTDFLKMTQPNVTFVVHSLERDGLVSRHPDPRDRRTAILRITPLGSAQIAEHTPAHLTGMSAALAGLSEAEREQLILTLSAVAEGFEDKGHRRGA